jgi:putative ABC transport system substrate-binding protein
MPFVCPIRPIGLGLVQSFARPGGNTTGVTDLELLLAPKRLQLFQEKIPHLKRVLFVYNADVAYQVSLARVYGEAAGDLGIELITKGVRTQDEARTILAGIRHGAVDGLLSAIASLNIPGFIQETEAREAIPAMHNGSFFVERGGLASYAPNTYEEGSGASGGQDPQRRQPGGDSCGVNPKLEFVIHLKTPKALGLSIAPEVLFQADRVVR